MFPRSLPADDGQVVVRTEFLQLPGARASQLSLQSMLRHPTPLLHCGTHSPFHSDWIHYQSLTSSIHFLGALIVRNS